MIVEILAQQQKEREERSNKIGDATKEGLARAKAKGKKLGGARRKSSVDMALLRRLRDQGLRQKEIAKILKKSTHWVNQLLRRIR